MNPSRPLPPPIPSVGVEPPHDAAWRGPLGQTKHARLSVRGAQGQRFVALVPTQVNAQSDPPLRQALLEGALTAAQDPQTGARYALALPVLYHHEGLQLFALVLPEGLRHQDLQHKHALEEQLALCEEPLPAYVKRFAVVVGAQELLALEQEAQRKPRGPEDTGLRLHPDPDERERRLVAEHQRLEAMRLNLEAFKARLDEQEEALTRRGKPPTPPPDNEPTVMVPRSVLSQQPPPLPTALGRKNRRWGDKTEQGWELDESPSSSGHSATLPPFQPPASQTGQHPTVQLPTVQLPTLAAATQPSAAPLSLPPAPPLARSAAPSSSASGAPSKPNAPASNPSSPKRVQANELPSSDDMPRAFNRLRAKSRPYYHDLHNGQVLLSYRLDESRLKRFSDFAPHLFLQFHDVEEFPLITLLVAALDPDGARLDDIYWPLDPRKSADRALLALLGQTFKLRVALYGEDLKLRQVLTFEEPLELNARHVLQLAEQRLEDGQGLHFDEALRRIEAPDYERLGSMRHNFHKASFETLETPGHTRLAAGIVGYWSGSQTFRYLIENRSFSLAWFDAIQKRVIHAAHRFGIALTPDLRRVAVALGLAPDEGAFVRGLAGAWTQTTLGLGHAPNDLDPLDTWHNWQDLIEGLEETDQPLDEELSNLASAALKRAQEFGQAHNIPVDIPAEVEGALLDPPTLDRSALLHSDKPLSEEGPPPPSAPGQADLRALDDESLRGLLNDPDKRLPAACTLIERGHADGALDVLVATEEMSDDEIEQLSEFLSIYAPKLEGVYLDALKLKNGTITYLCGFALASIPSHAGLGVLLDELQAGELDPNLFAEVLLAFGQPLLDPLAERLQRATPLHADHPLVRVLGAYAELASEDALDSLRAKVPEALALL